MGATRSLTANKSVRTLSHCAWKPAKRLVTASEGLANRWKGLDRIEGGTFTFTDRDTGRITAALGYSIDRLV
jgi:hypothetical protein